MEEATTSPEAAIASVETNPEEGQLEIPEKFRGPDGISKMTKAYTEAEKELRKVQEEKSQLAKEAERAKLLEQQLASFQQPKPVQSTEISDDDVFRKEWEEDPALAVLNRTKRAEERAYEAAQDTSQKFVYESAKKDSDNFPDFEKYEPTMVRLAQAYAPLLDKKQLRSPAVIPLLYKLARAEHLPDEIKSAEQRANEKAAKNRAAKNAATAEGSSSGSSSPSYKDLSLKEMEAILGFVER